MPPSRPAPRPVPPSPSLTARLERVGTLAGGLACLPEPCPQKIKIKKEVKGRGLLYPDKLLLKFFFKLL
jgi:hypothetical protein